MYKGFVVCIVLVVAVVVEKKTYYPNKLLGDAVHASSAQPAEISRPLGFVHARALACCMLYVVVVVVLLTMRSKI
jgi:hypothetical protein